MPPIDPVDLTAQLVRCPSVTPEDAGALDILHDLLSDAGFTCGWADRGGIRNLFARWGTPGNTKSFGFNGHTDVVPVGDEGAWTKPPFGAEIHDGVMYGRGTTDMKSGVAAFAAAAVDFVTDTPPDGSIVIAITGDEEGESVDGTLALLDYMEQHGERMDVCLVGEPTCPENMGDMIKIGRRGSMTVKFRVIGKQGHSAYPHRALNPLPAMVSLMDRLARRTLDEGTEHFDPSTLAVVTVDTGNAATNVIPADCTAAVNIRFNDTHTGASLTEWIETEVHRVREEFSVEVTTQVKISGESFITPPGDLSSLVATAVEAETGVAPVLSTSGGTSDARFVKSHCPVVEFGLVGQSMHQVDEHVRVEHIHQLKAIYARILADYFV
ncbi:succinyl-diaminopimelate desuccinylase [Sulfitobacter sp. HNIBRBA3233]|uniref:succinyl-diaminopimelate desuccinylase n=1 Tax=Sulfitobacter marinivivus TaxID=3158558 RepID=UPI0032DF2386